MKASIKLFERLKKFGYKHHYEGTVEELDKMKINNPDLHSEIMHVIVWFQKKYNVWLAVNYDYNHKTFYFYFAFTKNLMLGNAYYPSKSEKNPIKMYKLAICEILDFFTCSPQLLKEYQKL